MILGLGLTLLHEFIVIAAAATGNAQVWYDAAIADTDSVVVATLVGIVLADLATFAAANFTVA